MTITGRLPDIADPISSLDAFEIHFVIDNFFWFKKIIPELWSSLVSTSFYPNKILLCLSRPMIILFWLVLFSQAISSNDGYRITIGLLYLDYSLDVLRKGLFCFFRIRRNSIKYQIISLVLFKIIHFLVHLGHSWWQRIK